MPGSDYFDKWQREREGLVPDPLTPAEHVARMRGLIDAAEERSQAALLAAELGRMIRHNARESAYFRRTEGWAVSGDGPECVESDSEADSAPEDRPGRCIECGAVYAHHPACPMLGAGDYYEIDGGER